MSNLLNETVQILKNYGLPPEDVVWVGTRKGKTTWQEFKKLADKEYDEGFGGEEVNTKLLVVGNDWWLERHEYDGAEWWEFKRLPKMPNDAIFIQTGDRYEDDGGFYIFL